MNKTCTHAGVMSPEDCVHCSPRKPEGEMLEPLELPERVTPEMLAEWSALEQAATPGPWKASEGHYVRPGNGRSKCPITAGALPIVGTVFGEVGEIAPNAAFIAAARTAVPALIAALTEARRARDEARQEADFHRNLASAWKLAHDIGAVDLATLRESSHQGEAVDTKRLDFMIGHRHMSLSPPDPKTGRTVVWDQSKGLTAAGVGDSPRAAIDAAIELSGDNCSTNHATATEESEGVK